MVSLLLCFTAISLVNFDLWRRTSEAEASQSLGRATGRASKRQTRASLQQQETRQYALVNGDLPRGPA